MKKNHISVHLRSLGDWRFVLALGALLANDHFLKQAFGSWFTGKLSDFAGLIVFPTLIICIIGIFRKKSLQPYVFVVVAAWFAAMKTIPTVAAVTEKFAELFLANATIVVDPSDLLALTALPLAWRIIAKPQVVVSRREIQTAILVVAVAASVASTRYEEPDVVKDPLTGQVSLQVSEYGADHQKQACVESEDVCYRITQEEIQERQGEGNWKTIWALELGRSHEYFSGLDWLDEEPTPGLVDIEVDSQGVLYAAVQGSDSAVIRTVDGTWNVASINFRLNISLLLTTALVGATLTMMAFAFGRRAYTLPLVVVGVAVSFLQVDISAGGVFVLLMLIPIVCLLIALMILVLFSSIFSKVHRSTLKQIVPLAFTCIGGLLACVPYAVWIFTKLESFAVFQTLTAIVFALLIGFAYWLSTRTVKVSENVEEAEASEALA